jgi:hypothetical protein
MHVPTATIFLGLIASSLAVPIRVDKIKARQAITPESYADFQVSDGVAGNALAEVNAKFPVRVAWQQTSIVVNMALD